MVLTNEGLDCFAICLRQIREVRPEEREPDLQIVIDMNAVRNGNEVAKRLISKETIRALASAESFARGRSYFDDGVVSDVLRRGDRLTAEASMEVEALLRLAPSF